MRKLKKKDPNWIIYGYMAVTGWFAFNASNNARFHLTDSAEFSEAVTVFERETGHAWYASGQPDYYALAQKQMDCERGAA